MVVRIQRVASHCPGGFFRYARDRWDDTPVKRYVDWLFETFARMQSHGVLSHPSPAVFRVDGYFFHYRHHFVSWRRLANGDIGLVTRLHERMQQFDRLREDLRTK